VLITVRGTFKQGQITLLDEIPYVEECDVLVTFLDAKRPTSITDARPLAAEKEKALIQEMREQVLITLGLSPRELEILQCVYEGLKNREIAVKLGIGDGTVRNYLWSLYTSSCPKTGIQASATVSER
jgi:DNA-binding NarL/FixJ family response regulator